MDAPARAWVTLLTKPSYLVGVRALRTSLAKAGTAHPLVVLVTPDVDAGARELLAADGCLLREVAPIGPDAGLADGYAAARFAEVWTKLAVWGLTDYERVVFLDADMLVVRPMDELFELPLAEGEIAACHACRCNTNRVPTYPADWVPENCAYTHLGGDADRRGGGPVDDYLNAGFLVLRPDAGVLEDMLARLAALDDLSGLPFAEQDFLNDHFRGRWQVLPWVYNALKVLPLQHPSVWDPAEVKNIHYIGDKPWARSPHPDDRYYALDKLWWDVAG